MRPLSTPSVGGTIVDPSEDTPIGALAAAGPASADAVPSDAASVASPMYDSVMQRARNLLEMAGISAILPIASSHPTPPPSARGKYSSPSQNAEGVIPVTHNVWT